MTTSQIEIESQAIELSKQCLDTFWHEISTIFTVKSECNQQQVTVETAETLREHFDNLAAMISIKAEGSLNETFHVVFCRKGVFTLAGLMLRHPEQTVLENIELASLEKAKQMTDTVAEAANMLVGAFDRVFHEGLADHNSLVLNDVRIGNPREESDENIGLPSDGEFVVVPHEIGIGSYPPFNCSIVFPKAIICTTAESDTYQPEAPEDTRQEPEVVADKADSEKADPVPPAHNEEGEPQEPVVENNTEEQTAPEENTTEASTTEQQTKVDDAPNIKADSEQTSNDNGADAPVEAGEKETASPPTSIPVDETASSLVPGPCESNSINEVLTLCAEQIMQKELPWATQKDSVQQALAKLQQNNAGYLMIGQDETLEGIVSKSDLAGAISPYVQPIFAKWRRPLDDATLQIRIKWIMTTDIHAVAPETSLGAAIEKMCQFGVRSLPVVDSQGKAKGLITTFDVFKALLTDKPDVSAAPGNA